MKNITKTLFVSSLVLTLTACSGDESVELNSSATSVEATTESTSESNTTTTDSTDVETVEIITVEVTTEDVDCVAVSFENASIPCRDLGDE